jgi:hypothetical protein
LGQACARPGLFEFLAQGVVLKRQPLQVGDGDFDLAGEFAVLAAEAGVLDCRPVITRLPVCVGGMVRTGCGSPVFGDLAGDLREVAPEGGVGQAKTACERKNCRLLVAGLGGEFGECLLDLGCAGQWNSCAHFRSLS